MAIQTCRRCVDEFEGHKARNYCDYCTPKIKAERVEREKAERAEQRRLHLATVPVDCKACKQPFLRKHFNDRYCEKCGGTGEAATKRRYDAKRHVYERPCRLCGTIFHVNGKRTCCPPCDMKLRAERRKYIRYVGRTVPKKTTFIFKTSSF